MTDGLMFRRAAPADRDTVFAMVATVWDGDDYIPQVWDAWLHDAAGRFIAGVYDGQVVALAKLTRLTETDYWMEGVRVDPDFRGRGFARALIQECIAQAAELGAHTIRWITSMENEAMQRACASLAIPVVARPMWWNAPHLAGTCDLVPLGLDAAPRLEAQLADSALLRFNGGMLVGDWEYRPCTPDLLRQALAAGEILTLPGSAAWVWRAESGRGGWWVLHTEGPHDQQVQVLQALRHTSAPYEHPIYIRAQVLEGAPHTAALLGAGITPGDHNALVYGLSLQALVR